MTREKMKAAIRQQIRGRTGVATVQRLALDHMQPPIAPGRDARTLWLCDLASEMYCTVTILEADEQWVFRPDATRPGFEEELYGNRS